ncbi:LVIVD repeat-containing protein [Solirubrobacter deserti]|uniref:LVIVD repeat-containing protein n=1 Tax=Solirubrobacter deserti TaxID=2282478 RepID=A0ABT4RKA1_9ACTN|nr:hypothetical protein [Solirubrobacter deserti]MDA0138771.1 hypothetical protein [Solirubrobacter deserti]
MGAALLAGIPAAAASAQAPAPNYPLTSGDPRIGLAAGAGDTAGKAALGLEHLKNTPLPTTNPSGQPAVNGINSDAAFQGDYAFVGNFSGINIYNIANPAAPVLVKQVYCLGSQNDVSVHGNLLFVSVESQNAKRDCTASTQQAPATPQNRFRGVRIFDISDINNPVNLGGVVTCRGSHTHTLLTPKSDPNNVYIYVSGTSSSSATDQTAIAGLECNNAMADNPNSSFWRIEVIKVPLANPTAAAVVNHSRLFRDETTGRIDGLQNAPQTPQHPCASATPACTPTPPMQSPNLHGAQWQPSPITDACHDITVYEEIGLAAGACEGNGLLIDISDPANPKRIDAVADPLFAYWHGATFSNDGKAILFTDEWGGGNYARCRAADQLSWGADAIYEIVNKKLVFRSYYKLPVAQTTAENCVSHVGNLVPVRGKNIMIQAWYQGGASLIDWTDLSKPKEIGYFDRGPVDANGNPSNGGFWSTYWYNGAIYGTEISRGLDTFKLAPTAGGLTAADIRSAEATQKLVRSNPQSQVSAVYMEAPPVEAPVTGNVPATLSLSLGAAPGLGAFQPGVTQDYFGGTQATVISTAGSALLTVSDPSSTSTGHLVNGTFTMAQPLQVRARKSGAAGTEYFSLTTPKNVFIWNAPVTNDMIEVEFKQSVKDTDPLRTGTYSKTLTFTLSTTQP